MSANQKPKGKFQCAKCYKHFLHSSSVGRHMRDTHNDFSSSRVMLNRAFKHKVKVKALPSPKTTYGMIPKAKCNVCKAEFQSHVSLAIHLRSCKRTPSRSNFKMIEVSTQKAKDNIVQISATRKSLRHKCNICGLIFSSVSKLRCHVVSHKSDDSRKVSVSVCGRGVAPNVQCAVCGIKCSSPLELALHLSKHETDAKNLKFQKLKTARQSSSQIASLKNNLTDDKCKLCGLIVSPGQQSAGRACHCKTKPLNSESSKVVKYGFFQCELCKAKFRFPSCYKRHAKTHKRRTGKSAEKTIKANRSKSLNLTAKDLIPYPENIFECCECLLIYRSKESVKEHQVRHLALRPHICKECGIQFTRLSFLRAHEFVHTKKLPFRCDRCSASFNTEYCLKLHQNMHETRKYVTCSKCNFVFVNSTTLEQHIRIRHAMKKRFECDLCQSQFNKYYLFCEHLELHRRLKKLASRCKSQSLGETILPISNAETKTGPTLRKRSTKSSHTSTKIHSNEPKNICKVCGNGYVSLSYLKSHMMKRHQKFFCQKCKRYVAKSSVSSAPGLLPKYLCLSCNPSSPKSSTVQPVSAHLVGELVRRLVDEEHLQAEDLLDKPVDQQLSAVVELCGDSSVRKINSSQEHRSENIKRLFTLAVGEKATKILLQYKSVEEILSIILNSDKT